MGMLFCGEFKAARFGTAWLLFLVLYQSTTWLANALPPRVANTTLRLPATPPTGGYMTVEAFAGLSFYRPVGIVSPPGETNRVFVLEQSGRLYVITNLAQPTKTVFLDLSGRVNGSSEAGLLGLAFHPGYRTNRLFFVFYNLNTTTASGSGLHDRLARFEISPTNPNAALANSEVPLITQFDEEYNHNAGDLHFGPDGYLYVALGDEGGAGDAHENSQKIDQDFFSGILRLDVDGRPGSRLPNVHPASSTNYFIPPDNPWVGATNFYDLPVNPSEVRTEFWAVGLRNPWRMSFDPQTGLLYCGDVGQGGREEIDIITRGANYGWNVWEGTRRVYGDPPPGAVFTPPIVDYQRSGNSQFNGACVIGGVVYRGLKNPDLYGRYIFGDWSSGNIWALNYDGESVTEWRHLMSVASGLSAFGRDPYNGDILMANRSSGQLSRLIQNPQQPAMLPQVLSATGAFSNLTDLAPEPGIVSYTLNVPFWSDYAIKSRWFSVPSLAQTISFSPDQSWIAPTGTVWIKHFDMEMTNGVPASSRRLETRFIVKTAQGAYGLTYRWNENQTDAALVPAEGLDENLIIHSGGTVRTQAWRYPARGECLICHNPAAGDALGFSTAQLNRLHTFTDGTVTNQVLGLSQMGYLSSAVSSTEGLPAMVQATNFSVPIEFRVRSYLAANCAHCHLPGGIGRGLWDGRFSTPTASAGLIDGPLIENWGDPSNRVVRLGSLQHSMLFRRISEMGPAHMPPLATSELNQDGVNLLRTWIQGASRPAAPRNFRRTN